MKTVRFAKVLFFAACLTLALCLAASASASIVEDVITETDHVWAFKTLIKDADCSNPPVYQYTCTICGAKKTVEEGTTNGQHQWGEWVVDSAATCTTAGRRHRQCTLNIHHTEEQTIPALSHDLQWRITVAATCTSTGVKEQYCTRCGQVIDTQTIPQGEHVWGPWVTIKQPTCFEAGEQTHTCTVCGTVQNAPYGNALGHNWGAWQIITAATCDSNGSRTRVCQRDASHVETEVIPSPGHQWTAWRRVVEPTFWDKGREERYCTVCGKVETRELGTITYPNATLCAFGPRLKESNLYPNYSDKWYMFTPFDASVEGRQTYELVVDDTYIVGTATIIVANGTVSLEYELYTSSVQVDLEFFSFLPDMHVLNQYEPEELLPICGMEPGVPYSIADRFGGDTNLVLYFCSRVTYSYDAAGMSPLNYMSTYHQALLNNMLSIMD